MAQHKVLVIEDEKDLRSLIKYNFEKAGYRVILSKSAEEGLLAAKKTRPDIILLDIILPRMDGTEFCRIFRQESQTPIIFLTSRKSEVDKILGLKLGADDYVTKPFSVQELLARVEAVLRRTLESHLTRTKKPQKIGELQFDFERHEVFVKGKYCNVPPKEFELLRLLIQAKGKVLSRNEILEKVWTYADPSIIDTRTVDQHVARLRKCLQSEKDRIVTVANFGYKIKMDDNFINPLSHSKN